MLDIILKRQLALQIKSFNIDPLELRGEERDNYVAAMSTALLVELGEALQEVSWKPWASGEWLNRDAYIRELIDVLHFWCNLMLIATENPEEILEVYLDKASENAKRQEDGYTGIKCPSCGR